MIAWVQRNPVTTSLATLVALELSLLLTGYRVLIYQSQHTELEPEFMQPSYQLYDETGIAYSPPPMTSTYLSCRYFTGRGLKTNQLLVRSDNAYFAANSKLWDECPFIYKP